MDERKDEDLISLAQYGIHPVVKDITKDLSDPSFYYEYIITDIIRGVSQTYMDKKMTRPKTKELRDNLFKLFFTPNFNKKDLSKDYLKDKIAEKILPTTSGNVSNFDNIMKDRISVQAEMLDYLSMGDWRLQNFTKDDQVYLISYNNVHALPLIWMVISVNTTLKVARLHVWSHSLVAYFVGIFGLQDVITYKGLASFCLSRSLNVLASNAEKLYFTPWTRDNITGAKTVEALKILTQGVDKRETATNQQESLGESFYIPIDENVRQMYKKMKDLKFNKIEMCIVCETRVGTYYTEEYGKDVRFCGQECLKLM